MTSDPDNPYAAPEAAVDTKEGAEETHPDRRPTMAKLLWLGGLVVALYAGLNVVSGLVMMFAGRGDPSADAGSAASILVSLVFTTALLGLLSMFLFQRSRALEDPQRHSVAALSRTELERVYEVEQLAQKRKEELAATAGDYRTMSSKELLDVYRNIDRERVPERFGELLRAMKACVEDERSSTGGRL